ncbi:MAG: hypothetical protein JWM02_3663 [Frankiales bacterium]|nr:hypothetical protein [Frankiales bacterium]
MTTHAEGPYQTLYELERAKFQAETLRCSRILDALDHWRWIADQEWSSDPHKVLRDCIAEARHAANHPAPFGPGHAGPQGGADCPWPSETGPSPSPGKAGPIA